MPTDEWQEVRPGQVVPAGLHVRINLQTGKKEAKLLEREEEEEGGGGGGQNRTEQQASIGDIDDGGSLVESGRHGSGLRSYQELRRQLELKDVKFNTEFEAVQTLTELYANASSADRVDILDDLEFYLHQYDNARDFVTVGGMESIVRPAMVMEAKDEGMTEAVAEETRGRAALVFCACVQSHPAVKERVTSAGWTGFVLQRIDTEKSSKVRRRLVYALSCLLRGHSRSRQEFLSVGGERPEKIMLSTCNFPYYLFSLCQNVNSEGHGKLLNLISSEGKEKDEATVRKILILLSDLVDEEAARRTTDRGGGDGGHDDTGSVLQALRGGVRSLCPALANQAEKLTKGDSKVVVAAAVSAAGASA